MTLGPPIVLEISMKDRGLFLMIFLVLYYTCSVCYFAGLYYSNHLLCHSSTWVYTVNLNGFKVSVQRPLLIGSLYYFFLVVLCLVFLKLTRQMLPFLSFSIFKRKNKNKNPEGNHTFVCDVVKEMSISFFALGWNFITSSHFDYKPCLRFIFFK